MLAVLLPMGFASAASNNNDYLHASGNKLYDSLGNEVRLTGISWFGFETEQQVYHGLWNVKMENVLDTVANRGFNLLRIPLSVQLVDQWRGGSGGSPGSIDYSANPALQGKSSLQVLDASIAYARKVGLKVMLDMHRVVNTQQKEGWYTTGYPAANFEASWKWLATRYKNDDTVIAVDIFNEPHGGPGNAAMTKWDGSTDANNWMYEATKVANQILDINPKLLIVVQGVEVTPKDGFNYTATNGANYNYAWWGGNLRKVKDFPINLGSRQGQLVYSPHDYGPGVYVQPWFHAGFTEESLTADYWDPSWLYIAKQKIAPILVGEWGGKLDGGDNQKWLGFLANTIVTNQLSHTFWAVNPNSGDTGGILLDDWVSVDSAKYNLVEPTLWQNADGKFIGLDHEVNLGVNGTHVGAGSVNSAVINPTSASFDKNPAKQANILVTTTLNGNTLSAIKNGTAALVSGTDYTVSGNTVTLLKNYLAKQALGTLSLTFDFSSGTDPVLSVTIGDSSGVAVTGITVNPKTLALNGDATGQLAATVMPASATNMAITWNSSNPAVATYSNGVVTPVGNGTASITATVSAQNGSFSDAAVVTVTGKGGNVPAGCTGAVAVSLPWVQNGAGDFCRVTSGTISNINSWNTQLVEINGVAYSNAWSSSLPARINGNYYIRYVGQFGWSHLEVNGSGGSTVAIGNSTISPSTASFDKNTAKQADVAVTMTLNGNTLSAIKNGSATLVAGTDYTVSGNVVTILKSYLARLAVGSVSLTFDFSAGTDPVLALTVNDTSNTGVVNYTLTVAVNGNGSTSLTSGAHSYASGATVSVTASPASGGVFTGWSGAATGTANPLTIKMDSNKTLTANFTGGADLPAQCSGTCNAATPVPPSLRSDGGLGNVTMYSTGPSSGGACNYGSTNVKYYAAINVNVAPGDGLGQWHGGQVCGQCAEVTALTSQGPKTVVVRIMDKCPDGNCGIDLGGAAPASVMLDGAGRYTGKWRYVSCDGHPEVSDGSPSVDVVNGSNSWWSRLRVRNPLTGVAAIEWQDAAGTAQGAFPFASDPENAYEIPTTVLQSSAASLLITVRYVDGRSASVRLSPAQLGASGATYPLN